MTKFFIVIGTFDCPDTHTKYDSWTTHESYYDAHVEYSKNLKDDNCYTTSICNVVTSTDYDV